VRGRFGGSATRHGLELSATMTADERSGDWFRIHLEVRPTRADRPLTGVVEFHLHPTFEPRVMTVGVVNGRAATDLLAWGAFTAGALADDGRTPLELNLAELSIAPAKFRAR
jgi:hypothetical protein